MLQIRNLTQLYELSEQQILDCDTADQGCDGGDPVNAWGYVLKNGLETSDGASYLSLS